MLEIALSFETIIIWHKGSRNIVYFYQVPDSSFNYSLIQNMHSLLNEGKILLPEKSSQINHIQLNEKYALVHQRQDIVCLMIIHELPDSKITEIYRNFVIRLESRWQDVLLNLYTTFKGDISIFHQDTLERQNLDKLILEVFHLNYNFPYQIAKKPENLGGIAGKVFSLALELAQEEEYFWLADLVTISIEHQAEIKNRKSLYQIISNFVDKKVFTIGKQ